MTAREAWAGHDPTVDRYRLVHIAVERIRQAPERARWAQPDEKWETRLREMDADLPEERGEGR